MSDHMNDNSAIDSYSAYRSRIYAEDAATAAAREAAERRMALKRKAAIVAIAALWCSMFAYLAYFAINATSCKAASLLAPLQVASSTYCSTVCDTSGRNCSTTCSTY